MKKLLPIASLLLTTLTVQAQHTLISADFESDIQDWLYTGFKYNYTDGFVWNSTLASPGSLAFYHGSGTGHWITADPLDSENQVFYIDGFGDVKQDGTRGMYFMKLDLTGGGAYTADGGLVKVSYSFRMLRVAAAGEENDSPTQWQVSWISWYENPDAAVMEPGSAMDGKTVVKTFTTSGNAENWVTVEGSFLADLNKVDQSELLNTMIHVGATNGGFVSGGKGLYYIDDVLVTVSQGEVETPTWAGFDIFDEDGNTNTGSWMGWVNVAGAPWIYNYALGGWMYVNEANVGQGGAWVYILK